VFKALVNSSPWDRGLLEEIVKSFVVHFGFILDDIKPSEEGDRKPKPIVLPPSLGAHTISQGHNSSK
jgi:hypothetical protein